jgi:hypothetical protein
MKVLISGSTGLVGSAAMSVLGSGWHAQTNETNGMGVAVVARRSTTPSQ